MSKAVTLYAYTIENSDASRAYSDFTEKFRAKLSDSKTIRQRMLEINSQTHETDVLSQVVSYNNGYIYGTLMRIILSKEMPSLPSDYLDKNELSFSELDGVGYETNVITNDMIKDNNTTKFVPIIRKGDKDSSYPIYLGNKLGLDMTKDENYNENIEKLISDLNR